MPFSCHIDKSSTPFRLSLLVEKVLQEGLCMLCFLYVGQFCICPSTTAFESKALDCDNRWRSLDSFRSCKGEDKAVPLQAWSGPEGSRNFKVPRFHDKITGWW